MRLLLTSDTQSEFSKLAECEQALAEVLEAAKEYEPDAIINAGDLMIYLLTKDVLDLFWSQVDMSDGPDACWPWLGKKNGAPHRKRGYFYLLISTPSSRVAWILHHKRWPDKWVLHCCPNGSDGNCCNPSHLYDGTPQQNVADALREGHILCGEQSSHAKLSDKAVRKIRKLWASRSFHVRIKREDLAFLYGVSASHIKALVTNKERAEV